MQSEFRQIFVRISFAILVSSLVIVNAKPPHFSDATQVRSQEPHGEVNGFNNDQDPSINNLIDNGLRPWQMELLAQRMAELNQLNQMNNLNGQEYGGFDRALRSGNEIKRQSRYRLCYFNPVSCFKK